MSVGECNVVWYLWSLVPWMQNIRGQILEIHWTCIYWAPIMYTRHWSRRWWYGRQNRQKSLPLQSSWSLHSSEIKVRKLTHGEYHQVMSQKTSLAVSKRIPYCLIQKEAMKSLRSHLRRQAPIEIPDPCLRKQGAPVYHSPRATGHCTGLPGEYRRAYPKTNSIST